MDASAKRGALEGIGFGLIAGAVMAIAMIVAFPAIGEPPINVFRLIASLVLGQDALTTSSVGDVIAAGLITHLVVSAFFGLIYGMIGSSLSVDLQTNWAKQTAIGAVYGLALYLLNFQLIARARFPWFLDYPQGVMLLVHVIFYGIPLALMYVAAERRAHHLPTRPTTAGGAA